MARLAPAVPTPGDGIAHGTAGGVGHCRRRYGTTCEACRGYGAAAQNRYRARTPAAAAQSAAYDRALRAHASLHRSELDALYRRELEQLPTTA
jgi:hypothetical protein